ncbi:MAG: AcvB/VirJ family lysyl-phosphatidylglycerol hydrolase [Gemmatimonadota bacterium]|jgi:type IV secretory pathway VirJ component
MHRSIRTLLSRSLWTALAGLLLSPILGTGDLQAQRREIRGKHLPEEVRDLPLVVLAPRDGGAPLMALVMSGDGNWAHFVSELADSLVDRGIPVVGLESRAWLSHPRTPEELTRDMTRVLRLYLQRWHAEQILVVGYSRGADFAPFLVNRLPEDLRRRVRAVGLFSPSKMASFEFHLVDLVRYQHRNTDVPTLPELEKLPDVPVVCVYGTKDKDTLCPLIPRGLTEVVALDAGHRLHRAGDMADLLLDRVGDLDKAP